MFILQELWRGNITPSERFVRSGSEYKKIAGKLSDEMDRLNPLLDAVVDRFGTKDVQYAKVDDTHFSVTAKV